MYKLNNLISLFFFLRFSLNLQTGSSEQTQSMPLHFGVRFDENAIVRNNKRGDDWGSEERSDASTFAKGAPLDVSILLENNQFTVNFILFYFFF